MMQSTNSARQVELTSGAACSVSRMPANLRGGEQPSRLTSQQQRLRVSLNLHMLISVLSRHDHADAPAAAGWQEPLATQQLIIPAWPVVI